MKIGELSFLALRVLAIYFFVLGLNHLVNYLDYALPAYLQLLGDDTSYGRVFLLVGIPSILLLLISVALWLSAGKLSKFLVPPGSGEAESSSSFRGIEAFVLAAVGLVLAVLSVSSLARILLNYANMEGQRLYIDHRSFYIALAEQVIRLLLGIVLILKAEGFAKLLRTIRGDKR
ncbi:hypothetical protein [Cohnella cellulosilytica]|uniref:Uncharacterized protein n=1 Tax=Cohnella cellulosilytica TaxID=986710 RepID=A0ABW2FJ53_9BACL